MLVALIFSSFSVKLVREVDSQTWSDGQFWVECLNLRRPVSPFLNNALNNLLLFTFGALSLKAEQIRGVVCGIAFIFVLHGSAT